MCASRAQNNRVEGNRVPLRIGATAQQSTISAHLQVHLRREGWHGTLQWPSLWARTAGRGLSGTLSVPFGPHSKAAGAHTCTQKREGVPGHMAAEEARWRSQARRIDGLGRGAEHELTQGHGWGSTRPFANLLATGLLADCDTMIGRAVGEAYSSGAR